MWTKDAAHELYQTQDVWRLAHFKLGIYYEAKAKFSTGPPAPSALSWAVGPLGKAPVPTSIVLPRRARVCMWSRAIHATIQAPATRSSSRARRWNLRVAG